MKNEDRPPGGLSAIVDLLQEVVRATSDLTRKQRLVVLMMTLMSVNFIALLCLSSDAWVQVTAFLALLPVVVWMVSTTLNQ